MNLNEDKTELTNRFALPTTGFKRGFRFLGYNFMSTYKGTSTKSMDKLKDTVRDITNAHKASA